MDLFISKITFTPDATGLDVESFGTPRRLAKAIKIDLTIDSPGDPLYADNSIAEMDTSFSGGTISINASDLKDSDAAELAGQVLDDNDVIIGGNNDAANYYALGFRANKPSGKFRYIWLYKTSFQLINDSFQTKTKTTAYSTPTLQGSFMTLNKNGYWKADKTMLPSEATAQTWFNEVYEPEITPSAP
ncbi:MAG: phage tail protein [Clostridiales bacterium]|jgi:phi13 family phage major tail protein|nr:phage tail protein [Clostridiales bacterium]